MFVELEAAAQTRAEYAPELVPGLLQTPAYQSAVFESSLVLTAESAERQVRLRTDRQRAAFARTPPLRLTAVLGAGTLAREVGGPDVMAEQRAHLLQQARQPHIDLYVPPWSAGAHPGMKGAFVMSTAPDPARWVKASRSGDSGDCIEQRRHAGTVEVRDTKDHGAGPTLRFTPAEFAAWVDGARNGEFDHLTH